MQQQIDPAINTCADNTQTVLCISVRMDAGAHHVNTTLDLPNHGLEGLGHTHARTRMIHQVAGTLLCRCTH
jgi:hypothetical protein